MTRRRKIVGVGGQAGRKWVRRLEVWWEVEFCRSRISSSLENTKTKIAAQLDTFKGEKSVGDKTCRGSKGGFQFTKAPCIESCKNRKAIDGVFDGNG